MTLNVEIEYISCNYHFVFRINLELIFFFFLELIDSSVPKASSDFINLLNGLLQKDPQKRYVWMVF